MARLRAAGAVILGKLAMTEGAYAGYHPEMTVPICPWDPEAWPGTSSSGSGVATAAGLCYGSIGFRHRRLDPLSLGRQRSDRHQADLGVA